MSSGRGRFGPGARRLREDPLAEKTGDHSVIPIQCLQPVACWGGTYSWEESENMIHSGNTVLLGGESMKSPQPPTESGRWASQVMAWMHASRRLRSVTVATLMVTSLALLVDHLYGSAPPVGNAGETMITATVAEVLQPQKPAGWCLVVTMGGRYATYVTSETTGNRCQDVSIGDEIQATGTRVIGGGTRMPILEAETITISSAD